jgi:hypothetical protein
MTQREENMNESKKPIPNSPCPALNTKLIPCGKQVPYGHKGCSRHPAGTGAKKDLAISISQATAWLEIDQFFNTPREFKKLFNFETYRNVNSEGKEHVTDVVIHFIPTLSIARAISERIAANLEIDKTVLTYCLDRLIKIFRLYEIKDWVPELNNKGTDVDGFIPQHQLIRYCIDRIKLMTLLPTIEAIKFVLKSEYGYVNKFVKDAENYDLVQLEFVNTIISPGKVKINRGDLPYNKTWHEIIKQNIPIGIVYKDEKFVVIDGYIRGISAMKIGSDKEYFILMS